MRNHRFSARRLAAVFVPTAIALAACGGSDDASDPPGPVAPSVLSVSGTAATGAAIAAGAIDAKCSAGFGAGVSAADGSYRIEISDGSLPCILRVTAADGTVLHSLASGSGAAATANLTPLSELLVARLAGAAPASFFNSFDASRVTSDELQAANTAVTELLQAAGIDMAGVGNVLTAALVAANGSTPGNGFDQSLDALKAKLAASGTSLSQLRDTVARSSPAAASSARSNTASLPAELLLRPAAANCAALRSGSYRFVGFSKQDGIDTDTFTVDAPTLLLTGVDGPQTLVPNGPCRYTVGDLDITVAASGAMLVRFEEEPGGNVWHAGIAFPEQRHRLSALAGTWNVMGLEDVEENGRFVIVDGQMELRADGRPTSITYCTNNAEGCSTPDSAELSKIRFSAAADGSLSWSHAGEGWTIPVFAYRAGGGELMLVTLGENGDFLVFTRQVAATMPVLGRVSESVNYAVTNTLIATPASDSKNTVFSIDTATNRYVRDSVFNTTTGATQPETVVLNERRTGVSRRIPGPATGSDGSNRNVTEWLAMGLQGMGMSGVVFPASNQIVFSLIKPVAP